MNEGQIYVNIGTWTTIIQDIVANRYQDQRFPFLEVWYPDGSDLPQAQLLVWQGPEVEPKPWIAPLEVEDDE